MKTHLFLYLTFFLLTPGVFGQTKTGTLLWEISGNGLSKKSYIFGTNHIFDGTWLDSFTVVKEKLTHSEVVIGEMLSPQKRFIGSPKFNIDAANRKGFEQVFSKEEYHLVDTYMQSIGLSSLDKAPRNDPSVVLRAFFAILRHQTKKRLSMNENDKSSVDVVIERFADETNKRFIGLDQQDALNTSDSSKNSLPSFNSEALAKGILLLVKDISEGGKLTNAEIDKTNEKFIEWSDLKVQYHFNRHDPQKDVAEIKQLVIDRNEKWLEHLPDIIQSESSFIAVGIRHLKYKEGIISRLRGLGYKVRPVPIKRNHGL